MGNTLLTDKLLTREIQFIEKHCFYNFANGNSSVVVKYVPQTDRLICHVFINEKYIAKEIEEKDLQMSLDDFSKVHLYKMITKIADYYGYATWD